MRILEKLLEQLGVENERVRLDWVSASEGNKFVPIVNDMTAKLKELGPLAKS